MASTSKNSDAIVTALREGLADPYFDSVRNVAAVALAPVVEQLLAAEIKMLEDNWRFDDAMDAVIQARQAEVRASQAEQRLREIRKLAELNKKSWWGVSELFALLSDPPAGGK